MSPRRAHYLGVNPDDVRITSQVGEFGGAWILWVPDDERGRRILTQFGRDNIYGACAWLRDLRRHA